MADKPTDFDPDAYLQEAQGGVAVAPAGDFNPDEYLTGQTVPRGTSQPISALDIGITVPGLGGASISPNRLFQTAKNLGLEGGGATLGQVVGAPFEAVGGMHIGGAIGGAGGNALAQLTTPGKKFSWGEMTAAGAAGAIPGASLVKAGGKELFKQGTKYAAANVAGTNLQSLIDKGKPATLGEDLLAAGTGLAGAPISKFLDRGMRAEAARVMRSLDAVRRETLAAGRGLGLVVPPSVTNPNALNNTINSLAGKAATAQEAVLRNQLKINAAVKAEIGLPTDAPLSPIAINTLRVGPNMVYDKIAKTSDEAAGLLANFKQSTADANELYAAYRTAPIKDPSLLARAKVASVQADVFKQRLEKVVDSDLMKEFDAARVQLAKIGMADRATRLGDGNVDAKVFGDALEHGEKLTGNFAKLGRFQSAFGRYVQEAAKTPPSGVDHLKMLGKLGLGGVGGYAAGGVPGALAGAAGITLAEKGARELALSPAYQRNLAAPFYGAAVEDPLAAVARFGAMEAGRELPSLDTPLTEEEMKRLEELRAQLTRK